MLTLLINAHLFDPADRGVNQVLIAGGKVVWIGSDEPRLGDLEHSVKRVDVEERPLVPGLIDPHVHFVGGGGEAGAATRVPPLLLEQLTSGGITTAVGLLGTDDLTRSPADLLAQTRGLCDQGLDAWCFTGGYHVPPATVTGSVRSDIVHIDRFLGVGEIALSDHRSSQPTLNELLKLAAEAHVAGLMTNKAGIVHLHMGDGERGLDLVRKALDESELPARTFHPTHVNRRRALFDEALGLVERGATIDITTFPPELAPDELNEEDQGPDDELVAAEALIAYLDSGLDSSKVTMSSDGGGCLPRFDAEKRVSGFDVAAPTSIAACLDDLLRRGQPLERVLPAFTANTADLLRLPQGRISVGADANLVILDPNESAPGLIRDVMLGGNWHRRKHQQLVSDLFTHDS